MALHIKNPEVERLAAEVARITGETKTEAIRRALMLRRARLRTPVDRERRYQRLMRFLETEVWPNIPPEQRGRRLTKEEREEILGYGEGGV